jgi:hypothetical protein
MSGSALNSTISRWIGVIACSTLLAGCAGDRYFMVEKEDIGELRASVSEQSQEIERLDRKTGDGFESVTRLTEESTQSILSAISAQAEQFSCPPSPRQPACEISSDKKEPADSGRADRLKGKVVVGEVEKFYLVGADLTYDARIDSGAETSSLDARNITRFERDGSNWVRFDVPKPGSDDLVTIESEISRRVKIIQSTIDEAERRVVVQLQFMIGDHRQEAEFTLTDRGHLSHRVLVGRNILRDVMLIDVGKEFATELPSTLPNQDSGEDE